VVPGTAGTLVGFLLFVTPGIAFELLRQRIRPAREDSAFIEASRVLLAGLLLTALAVLLLGLLHRANSDAVVDVSALVREGSGYAADHIAQLASTATIHLLLVVLLAVAANDLLTGPGSSRIAPETAWYTAFVRSAAGAQVRLSIQMTDGTTLTGRRADFSDATDPAKRELVLAPPITMRRPRDARATPLSDEWQRLIICGEHISSIACSYVSSPKTEDEEGRAKPGRLGLPSATFLVGLRGWWRWTAAHQWQSAFAGIAVIMFVAAGWR
jgi:hypothetical protein